MFIEYLLFWSAMSVMFVLLEAFNMWLYICNLKEQKKKILKTRKAELQNSAGMLRRLMVGLLVGFLIMMAESLLLWH